MRVSRAPPRTPLSLNWLLRPSWRLEHKGLPRSPICLFFVYSPQHKSFFPMASRLGSILVSTLRGLFSWLPGRKSATRRSRHQRATARTSSGTSSRPASPVYTKMRATNVTQVILLAYMRELFPEYPFRIEIRNDVYYIWAPRQLSDVRGDDSMGRNTLYRR